MPGFSWIMPGIRGRTVLPGHPPDHATVGECSPEKYCYLPGFLQLSVRMVCQTLTWPIPKIHVGVRRWKCVTFRKNRGFSVFQRPAAWPSTRLVAGKNLKGHFKLPSVQCVKNHHFWTNKTWFLRIKTYFQPRDRLPETCHRRRTEDRIRPGGYLALRLSYDLHRKRWYKPPWPLELLGQFFSRPDFFKPEIFARKNYCAGNFPDPDFSRDPEIAILPRNLKIVPFWDFQFLHFLLSKFSTSENFWAWIFFAGNFWVWKFLSGIFFAIKIFCPENFCD